MAKEYWFVRKTYGWGWTPATWQGWLVLAVYLIALVYGVSDIERAVSVKEVMVGFVLPLVLLTAALIVVCYKTGESPRWQWGEKK